jgi:hypothetical protein
MTENNTESTPTKTIDRVSEEKICLQPADGLALLIAFNSFSESRINFSLLDAGQLMNQLLDGDGSRSAMQILLIHIICIIIYITFSCFNYIEN